MTLRSHHILAAAAEEMLAAYGIDRTKCGSDAGAAMEMRRISNKKALEESQRNLDEIQESIEQNAENATAPKDENGNPIATGLPAESAGEAVPMPEVSGSNPAPAPEVPADPSADVAQAVAPTPEVAPPSAPSIPSIDITV